VGAAAIFCRTDRRYLRSAGASVAVATKRRNLRPPI
jgi:hypothetical protein